MSTSTTADVDARGPDTPERRRSGKSGLAGKALAIGALGIALIAVGAAVAIGRDKGGPETRVTAGANVTVNQDPSGLTAHNSPSIVVSPVDPNVLVTAGRVDRPQFGAGVHVSRDGGATWADANLVLPAGKNRAYTPEVAFDARGNLYALFATLDGEAPAQYPSGLWLESSADAGTRFSAPAPVAGAFTYQPRMALDPASGHIHVTWAQATEAVIQELATGVKAPADVERSPGFGPPPPVVMATSDNGGASFSTPVQVNEQGRLRVGAATPAVGRDGNVFVLYQDFGDDISDFEGRAGPVHNGRFALVLAESSDRGKSFATRSVVEKAVVPSERFLAYLPKFPSLAVDPSGTTLYVAWSDNRNGDWDVFVRRSSDSGKSWSGAERVNDDKVRSGRHQYLPQVAVAPNGRVDVLYLDRRNDANNVLTAASLATSFDKGKTWKSVTASDAFFNSQIGPRNERSSADSGSRIGLVSTNSSALATWADTRRGTQDTDKQDLVFTAVTFAPQ